ncbi:MAG: HEAT repeat domain-containing protein [Candidatus Aenigmatarchaeota archaeon]
MIDDIEELKDKRKIDQLLRILQEETKKRRADAAKVLGMMKSSRERDDVSSALVERLKEDEEATVRANAALALGHLKSATGKKALKAAAEDDDWEVRHDAAIAMGEYEEDYFIDTLYSLLDDEEDDVKRKSIEALGKIGSETKSDQIVSRLEKFLDEPLFEEEVVRAVSQIDTERGLRVLSDIYKNGQREIRETAINGVGKIEGEKADRLLINALEDESWRIREDAARLLGARGTKKAVEPLLEILESDDEKDHVVQEAMKALGSLVTKDKKSSILDKIEEKIRDDEPETRMAAAEALEKINDEKAAELLFEALKQGQNPRVLWAMADSLSSLSKKHLKELKEEVDEIENSRKVFAAVGMGKAGFSSYLEELLSMLADERWKVRQKAAESLRNIDAKDISKNKAERTLKKLSKTMKDNDKWVRVESVRSLGEMIFDLRKRVETEEFKKELLKRAEVEADEDVIDAIERAKNLLDI